MINSNQVRPIQWIIIGAFLSTFISCALAQDSPITGQKASPYSSKPILNDPDQFQFIIVSDRTGGHRPGVFAEAIRKVNLLQPEFVMSVGDLIEGYSTDVQEIEQQWEEFDSIANRAEMRFFYLPGNHDFSNKTMGDVWKERLGPDYYHFLYKNTLFLCLNSEDGYQGAGKPTIGEKQYQYFQQVLADHPEVRWTFVFTHQPLWLHEITGHWPQLELLLQKRKHTVFAGHVHQYTHYDRNDSDYIVLGTTGGVSKLRGKAYGEVDHLTWVTLTPDGPVMSNLMLDGIETVEFATEQSVAIFNGIAQHSPVRIKPVYIRDSFQLQSLELILNNSFPYPMELNLQALAHRDILLSIPRLTETVAPGMEKSIKIPIQRAGTSKLKELSPVEFEVKGRLDSFGHQAAQWHQVLKFLPQQAFSIGQNPAPIALDGQIEEWEELPYHSAASNQQGAASFRFNVIEQDSHLYLGIRVVDPVLQLDGMGKGFTDSEGIMVSLDFNEAEVSAYNTGDIAALRQGKWMVLGIVPTERIGSIARRDRLQLAGIDGIYKIDRQGYAAEIKIPKSLIERTQGKEWSSLRLNVRVNDKTNEKTILPVLWQNNWWEDNIPGSGMFFR